MCREDRRGYNCPPLEVNPTQSNRKQEERKIDATKKKKLEEFLDPGLLSSICAKIGQRRGTAAMKLKREVRDFDWPVDELKPFMAASMAVEKPNIDDDVSLVHSSLSRDSNVCDEIGGRRTPFRHLEKTALKRFKGEG